MKPIIILISILIYSNISTCKCRPENLSDHNNRIANNGIIINNNNNDYQQLSSQSNNGQTYELIDERNIFLYYFFKYFDSVRFNISRDCRQSYDYFRDNLNTKWAMKMIDSNSVLESGLMDGNIQFFGEFDQCLDLNIDDVPKGDIQYCTIQFPVSIIMAKNESDMFPSFIFSMVPPTAGICLPAACSKDHDLPIIFNELSKRENQNELIIRECITRKDLSISQRIETIHMIIIAIFAAIILMIIVGTSIEMCNEIVTQREQQQQYELQLLSSSSKSVINKYFVDFTMKLLICFSLKRNLGFLLKSKPKKNKNKRIDCINGIRVLSFLFILIYHTFTEAQVPSANLLKVVGVEHGFLYQFITNAGLWVDTFFLLSGFVMAYPFLSNYGHYNHKDINNNDTIANDNDNKESALITKSIWQHLKQHPKRILHRYIRLTPSVAAVIGLSILIELIGSGPLWNNYVNLSKQSCHKNWWNVLLYTNNFCSLNSPDNPQRECLSYLWYLAVDMQFFVISPLLIVFLIHESKKMRTIGVMINISFILASSILTAILMAYNNLTPTILVTVYDLNYINMVYKASYCRIGPYCVGILMAYYYYYRQHHHQREYLLNNVNNNANNNSSCSNINNNNNNNNNNNGDMSETNTDNDKLKCTNSKSTSTGVMLLLISIIMMLSITMLTYPWLQGSDYKNAPSILYGCTHRTLWAFAWSLLLWALIRKHLPSIDQLFSLPMFNVLSKLTYQSYLLHSVLISAIISSVREKIYFSELNFILHVISYFFLTQFISIITFVMFERPFINFETTFLHSDRRHNQTTNQSK